MTARQFTWLMLGLLYTVMSLGANADFTVEMARVKLVNEVYIVDADVHYRLSEQATQALRNSVPLTIELEIEIRQPDAILWDTRIAHVRRQYRVEHHPLTDQVVIDDLVTGTRDSYFSIDDALDALGHVKDIAVVEGRRLESPSRYRAFLRTQLEIEALPAPLRLRAYFSPGWHMSSGWFKWDFDT